MYTSEKVKTTLTKFHVSEPPFWVIVSDMHARGYTYPCICTVYIVGICELHNACQLSICTDS